MTCKGRILTISCIVFTLGVSVVSKASVDQCQVAIQGVEIPLDQLPSYDNQQLFELRDKQLLRELTWRGLRPDQGLGGYRGGYQALEALSQQNLHRLLEEFKQQLPQHAEPPLSTNQEIDQALAKIELAFVHNAARLTAVPATSLLSSRELKKLGISKSLNSKPFNQDILQTDGNVYFFAIPYSAAGNFPEVFSAYGNTNLVVQRSYAIESGWTSPYVMNPDELVKLISQLKPELLHAFLEANHRHGSLVEIASAQQLIKANDVTLLTASPATWHILVDHLAMFDLTPIDLKSLIQQTLKLSLKQLYSDDFDEYQKVIETINSGSDLFAILKKHSIGRLGYQMQNATRGLELKIPVSVPPQQLYQNRTKDPFTGQLFKDPRMRRDQMDTGTNMMWDSPF